MFVGDKVIGGTNPTVSYIQVTKKGNANLELKTSGRKKKNFFSRAGSSVT